MKITVFTGNQPRHISLIEAFAEIAEEVYVIQECVTVFPGIVSDFYRKSEVMQTYFKHVLAAEEHVFGRPRFSPKNVRHLSIKDGDLNRLEMEVFDDAFDSDVFIVFGASFIKPPLIDVLVEKRAYNIHMGTSPFYRGSSCNFWALYDRRASYVGATIHLLSKGLDSGPMLFHALPGAAKMDPFMVGMVAVKAAQDSLVHHLKNGTLASMEPKVQDKTLEIRYTKSADFTDAVAKEYLERLPSPENIYQSLLDRRFDLFLRPHIV